MKNIVLLSLLLCLANTINAQQAYIATYKYSFPDTTSFDKMSLQNLSDPSLLSYKRGDTDSRKLKLVAQLKKDIYNCNAFTCYCYPGYTAIDYTGGENNKTVQKNQHSVLHIRCNGTSYNIFNYANNSYYAYNKYDTIETKHAMHVNPLLLHFVPTGEKKTIGKWKCHEYRLVDAENVPLRLWACRDLPAYIHPGVFSKDIKAGIVELDYKNEKINLVEVEATKYKFDLPVCNTDTVKQTYNFINVIEDTYHDAMGD